MKDNVIGLEKAKNDLANKRADQKFKSYLGSLKQEELQTEANYIMNNMGSDLDAESLKKSAMLMEELAKRVSVDTMSSSINDFASSLREKIDTKAEKLH